MKYRMIVCATVLMLYAAPALANECEIEIAEVEAAILDAIDIAPEVLDVVTALLERAIQECDLGDPLEGGVRSGLSMLAEAKGFLEID